MLPNTLPRSTGPISYPERDGKPMADNSKQARWIVVLFGNIGALVRNRQDVLVAADMFWYPREGEPEICNAPDVMVIFGRPKGDRGSYKQWEEGNVPVTVAFEILSPDNKPFEMADKHLFYEEHGVEEYYVYDQDHNHLAIYIRRGEVLRRVGKADGFVSPRLGIRFDLSGPEMIVYRPDGRRFLTFEELEGEREQAEQRATDAEQRASNAEQRATDAEQRADEAERRAARLMELGRKARQGMASVEELQELSQLEEQIGP